MLLNYGVQDDPVCKGSGSKAHRSDPGVWDLNQRGTLRLRPAVRTRVPTWDLAIVLEGLSLAPFELIE